MQYLLSKEEYQCLVSRKILVDEFDKVTKLNEKVMQLSNSECNKGKAFTFYCDDCPIGILGTGTCQELGQQYSK